MILNLCENFFYLNKRVFFNTTILLILFIFKENKHEFILKFINVIIYDRIQ